MINVPTQGHRRIIGQHLSDSEMDERCDQGWCSWHDDLVSEICMQVGLLLLMNADDQPPARTNFLDIREGGVELGRFFVRGEKGQRVHVGIDQGNGAVFEKAAGHPFGM